MSNSRLGHLAEAQEKLSAAQDAFHDLNAPEAGKVEKLLQELKRQLDSSEDSQHNRQHSEEPRAAIDVIQEGVVTDPAVDVIQEGNAPDSAIGEESESPYESIDVMTDGDQYPCQGVIEFLARGVPLIAVPPEFVPLRVTSLLLARFDALSPLAPALHRVLSKRSIHTVRVVGPPATSTLETAKTLALKAIGRLEKFEEAAITLMPVTTPAPALDASLAELGSYQEA